MCMPRRGTMCMHVPDISHLSSVLPVQTVCGVTALLSVMGAAPKPPLLRFYLCCCNTVIKLNRFITGKLQKGHSAPKQTACDGQQVSSTKLHTDSQRSSSSDNRAYQTIGMYKNMYDNIPSLSNR